MSDHIARYLALIGGAIVVVGSVVLRLCYGPRDLFGKHTKPIVYGGLCMLGLWNLYLWTQQHDAWTLAAATGGIGAGIIGFAELLRKRHV